MRHLFFSFLFCLVGAGCAGPSGRLVDRSEEGYVLFLPDSPAKTKLPLLVALPGRDAAASSDISNWTSPARKRGFAVLDLSIDYDKFDDPLERETRIASLHDLILLLTRTLSAQHPLDTSRLYLAGSSAGGAIAISLALRYPDQYAAVGVVGGAALAFGARDHLTGAKGEKFFLVHGEWDKVIPIESLDSTQASLEENGAIVRTQVVEGGEHTLPQSSYHDILNWFSAE